MQAERPEVHDALQQRRRQRRAQQVPVANAVECQRVEPGIFSGRQFPQVAPRLEAIRNARIISVAGQNNLPRQPPRERRRLLATQSVRQGQVRAGL